MSQRGQGAAVPAAGIGVPLTLALAPRLAPLLAARLQGLGERAIADLSCANLWLFRRVHDYRFLDGDWPAISGLTYDGQRHLLPLFAPHTAPAELWQGWMAGHAALFPLTEPEAQALDPLQWAIDAHRDDADYLYPAEHFRHYRGTALQKKRNLIRRQGQGAWRGRRSALPRGLVVGAISGHGRPHRLGRWRAGRLCAG